MFGKIKCIQCGEIINGHDALKNSGNTFCSEECSDEYRKDSGSKHGCCC